MSRPGRRLVGVITVTLLAVLPAVALWAIFANVARGGDVTDFESVFYEAARSVADGESPYPVVGDPELESGKGYVYPPLTALVVVPLTALPVDVAGLAVMALLIACFAATLGVLGIRDWRCYALSFLWPPVLSAIQTGNITIPLALSAALVWRFRDSARGAGMSMGLALAAKPVLWPLMIWLAATRRFAALAVSAAAATLTLAVTWGALGFAGIRDYLDLLRRLTEIEEKHGYTVYALALDLGTSSTVARLLWAFVAVAALAGTLVMAIRGDHQRAFVVAIAACLACTPIVWQHYFALLLVVVAVAEPRLGPAWFVPLVMYGTTGTLNGTPLQTAIAVGAAALTVGVASISSRARGFPLGVSPPRVAAARDPALGSRESA